MKTFKDLLGKEKGRNALVIGAAASVKEYQTRIAEFIKKTNPIIIGINNMTAFWIPDYHVWTNNQRFRDFGKSIHPKSKLLLGSNISLNVVRKIIGDREYFVLDRIDKPGVAIEYKDGTIYGYFRTAGCLAIMLLYLMGADEINVVGMDGYSLYKYEDVISGKKSQHCYGKGLTDTADWETGVKKDRQINDVLRSVRDYGIDFKILTPTKYEEFYDSTRLHI